MNVQSFLKSALKVSLPMLGAETIIIAGKSIQAVEDETHHSNSLGIAAVDSERMLVVKFPADAFRGAITSGMAVTARGQSWQVSSDPDAIRKGQIATTLILIEPERRKS